MPIKTLVICDRCGKEWQAKKSTSHFNGIFGKSPLYFCNECSELYRDLLFRLDRSRDNIIQRFKCGELPKDLIR